MASVFIVSHCTMKEWLVHYGQGKAPTGLRYPSSEKSCLRKKLLDDVSGNICEPEIPALELVRQSSAALPVRCHPEPCEGTSPCPPFCPSLLPFLATRHSPS